MEESRTYKPEGFDCVDIGSDLMFNKDYFPMPDEDYTEIDHILIPEGLIKSRVEKIAQNIYYDYGKMKRDNPLQIFVIMNGSFQYFSDLQLYIKKVREYNAERLEYDVHFVKVKGYVNTESKLESIDDAVLPEAMIKGHDILIVEDVYDSGNCMDVLLKHINKFEPNSVKSTILIHKCNPKNLKYDYKAEYIGFTVPGDKFLVGYGMDYNEKFRDLSHVCVISKEGIEKYKH
jgi:hypoxanthine phosphoribosyltransferase